MRDLCEDACSIARLIEPALPLFVIGHSMGGKTGLQLALEQPPSSFAGLVSLDASPVAYKHTHSGVFDAMKRVDFAKARSKSDVDAQLAATLPVSDRQFLLANNLSQPPFRWRANVDVLVTHGEADVLSWSVRFARMLPVIS